MVRSALRSFGFVATLSLVLAVVLGACGSSSKKPSDGGAGHDGGAAGHDGGAAGSDAAQAGSDGGTGDVIDAPADLDGGDAIDAPSSDANDAASSDGGSDAGSDAGDAASSDATDAGTDGDASACEAGTSACAVAGSLSGLLWKLPCTAYESGPACATTAATTESTQLAGTAGVTYDVTLRFRGIVEQKTYTSGCGDGTTTWLQSGADNGDSFNVYKLTISSPPQTYFLNAGASNINHLFGVDFQQTVRIDAGATVTLFADAKDGQEIINVGADGTTPVMVAGTSVTQPYNGQFIQMDVVSVAADPVASSATIGGSAGGALAFDGSKAQMLTAADATSLRPTSLTFESWFTFSGTTAAYAALGCKTYGTASGDSMCLWYESGALHGGVNATSPAGVTAAPWTPVANEWHHAALVFDAAASKTTMYLDGVAASCVQQTGPIVYDDHAFVVGADIEYGSPNGFWNGAVDETRLFSTARTPAQIWADMHTRALGATTGLVAEWTFDEGTGQTTADKSGTGNAATLGATNAVETADPSWVSSTAPH
jgi:hypothetical protein